MTPIRPPGREPLADEEIDYCRRNLTASEYPRIVEFVDELPKGPTGETLKRELR